MSPTPNPVRRRTATALAAACLTLAAACRFSPGPEPTPAGQVGFLPLTEVASITPPAPPRRSCLPAVAQPAPPSMSDPWGAAPGLLEYLNAGGDPAALAEMQPDLHVAKPDLDGDGWVDVAFILKESAPEGVRSAGSLLIYHCLQGRFELAYSSGSKPERAAPVLHGHDDLNADGNDDLLVSQEQCGAHTCVAEVQVLMWLEGGVVNRFEGPTNDLPSPSIEVHDGGSGPAEIAVTAGGVNSAGAGPFRPVIRVWTWDPAARSFRPTREQESETVFRVHRLHDADALALDGRYAAAIDLYERVIVDASLRDWVDPEREQRVLSAYARFRQITSSLQMGNRPLAEEYLRSFRATVREGEPGAAYLEMAEAFWDDYQLTDSVTSACLEAQAYAAAHRQLVLDPLYFGYANPVYGPADICPLAEDG